MPDRDGEESGKKDDPSTRVSRRVENDEASTDGDGVSLPVRRRSLLKAAASGATLLGSTAFVGAVQAAQVVDLGNKGLTNGDKIDPYLDSYFTNGNEVHVPEGTYPWDGTSLNATADAALIGDGNVEFDIPTIGLMENVTAKSGTVKIKNITQTGAVDSTQHSRIAAWAEEGAKLVFENFNRPDGQVGDGSGGPIGFYTPPEHYGTMVYRDCHVEGFGNNGIYASAAQKQGDGPVIVEGGLYKNNNIAGVRVGSSGSVVRNVTIFNDAGFTDVIGPGGGRNSRLLWVRTGGSNVSIDDVDLTATSGADGTVMAIGIHPRNGGGNGTVTNARIWNGRSMNPVKVKDSVAGNWSGSGVQLTGGGNLTVGSDATGWISCKGSDCTEPTRQKQWIGDGTSSTSLSVATGNASNVDGTSATLQGDLANLGGVSSATVGFEYRQSGASSWSSTGTQSLSSTGSFSADVSGLSDGTDYEYRSVATASDGTTDAGGVDGFSTVANYDHHLVVDTVSGAGVDYELTVSGQATGGADAETGGNDNVTRNSDGTYTISGATGNGYTDDWYFDGSVTAWSAQKLDGADTFEYTLVLDGQTVTPDELTRDTSVVVSTGSATNVDDTSATLQGTVEDLGGADSTKLGFRYRRSGASDWSWAGASPRSSTGGFSTDVTGLDAGTDYEFQAVANASDGDADTGGVASFGTADGFDHHLVIDTVSGSGVDYSLTVPGPVEGGPDAETGGNDSVTQNADGTYTVTGGVGNGYADDWYFDGSATAWSAQKLDGSNTSEYTLVLDGRTVTPDELTGDAAPTVTTGSAGSVGESSATLKGSLEDLGGASSADVGFQYRETGASNWSSETADTLSSTGSFSQTVSGLAGGTEYEFRARAVASDGDTDAGGATTFATDENSTPPSIDRYEVTEAGSRNPHLDVTVEWDVSDPDGDLAGVLVEMVDASGSVVDSATRSVGGDVAYGVDYFKVKNVDGQTFQVRTTVRDADGNEATQSATVTE